jgi:putative FmdB family regulatory protein
MPLYEYQCGSCGVRTEKIRKFSDPPLTTCEACGGPLEKLVSSPAIQFKGSGWYITDYAKKTAVEGTATAGKTASGKSEGAAGSGKGESSDASSGSSASSASGSSTSANTTKS